MKRCVWSLTWCIGHQEWKAVRDMLQTDNVERHRLAIDEDYVATLLDAPFDIVKNILNANPKAILTPCGRAAIKFATHANASLQVTVFLHVTRQQQEAALLSTTHSCSSNAACYQQSRPTNEESRQSVPFMSPQRSLPLHTTTNDLCALSLPHILEKSLEISQAKISPDSDMKI